MSKRYPGGIIRKTPQTPSQTSAQGIWDMASVTQAVKENTWPIAGVPDPISKSLRFRSSASANLTRTPPTSGNRKTWTWSAWIKRGALTQTGTIWGSNFSAGGFGLAFGNYGGAGVNPEYIGATLYAVGTVTTTAVFRDPSAWYHIVVAFDSTQATQSNRFKLYVNNVQQTMSGTLNVTLNADYNVNLAGALHVIGGESTYYNDMYMTEVYFIDGQALTPSSFGSTNDQTGVWQPIVYTGTYGTNGFYLPFSNTASTTTLGYDFSGNSNNWTPNNISLTSGSTYDSMVDVPTQWIPYNTAGDTGALFRGNYCVLNPISRVSTVASVATITNGNLDISTTTSDTRSYATFGFPTSGKYYYELTNNNSGSKGQGIASYDAGGDTYQVLYFGSGNKQIDGTSSAYGASYTTNDVIGVAVDIDNNQVTFYKNGASQGAISYTFSGKPTMFPYIRREGSTDASYSFNFGQRPFSYTPPTGFKTLCTTNLSTPTIGATATTTANKYFDATTYTGNASTNNIVNSGAMQPDFVWIKNRSNVQDHSLTDAVRGTNYQLASNTTAAETFSGFYITSLNSNGFSLYAGAGSPPNTNGQTYVAWQWRASNATAVTNTAGSITSTVSANTTAGFSIVTYTGTGANATIGHGLGVAPSMVIVKQRGTTITDNGWRTYHVSVGATKYLILNGTDPAYTFGDWNNTAPTSTVFSVGSTSPQTTNGSGATYVAYCFAQVANYSAFGSYTGNGSSDGPFVFTGFRPRYILIKRTDSTGNWTLDDAARSPYNVGTTTTPLLYPNLSIAEANGGIDLLSNGFKIRFTDGDYNTNGATYIYAAFAESPFKYALAR